MLTRLEELGFVPPEDDEGKPHPALAALLPNYFTFDGIVPWAVAPSERAPREIVLNFIRAMHVWETGLVEWGKMGAGYPGPMAHELIYDILAEFGLPKEKGDDLCYSNPSNYHPETATIAEETTLSTDKARITTRGNDPFDTEHTFVLRDRTKSGNCKRSGWRTDSIRQRRECCKPVSAFGSAGGHEAAAARPLTGAGAKD